MQVKRLIIGTSVTALVALGAFAAAGLGPNTGSAQTTASRTQSAASLAAQKGGLSQAAVSQQYAAQIAPAGQKGTPTQVAKATEVAQTPEATEVAGTPEPTEVAGTPGPEPTEAAGKGEGGTETAASEAADAQALASKATVSQQQAERTALAANAGTTVTHSSLGDENGTVVYDVELSNGSDVKVNAQTGAIIATDTAGSDGADSGETGNSKAP